MTEHEAEVWAKRLARVWEPSDVGLSDEHQQVQWHQNKGHLHFISSFTASIHMGIFSGLGTYILTLMRKEEQVITGILNCVLSTGRLSNNVSNAGERKAQFLQFDSEWMPYFRRSCWLSGCPIEATAHEKAEWMQGFSRAEIGLWNLKM